MYLSRQITTQIEFLIDNFPVTGIIGPRQVGKTTLAKKLMKQIAKPSLYLDLELEEDFNKLGQPQLFLEQYKDKCVILDEIQRLPSLFPLLRALVDKNKVPGRFLILGSASPKMITYSSESLAGRIVYKELAPFNLCEINDIKIRDNHWMRGGYPEPLLAKSDRISKIWMQNFVQTYLERDLRLLGLTVDPVLMRRFWTMLSHFHGNIWNASIFSKSLGIAVQTVNRYLNFLEGAFVVRRLQPFHANVGKRLVKSPKVYLRDTGMLHHLAGIQSLDMLHGHMLLGHSWEGYVVEQIAQMLPESVEMFYYRTHNGTEVDCVLALGGVPKVCIEIKYSASPKLERGLQIAIEDLKTTENYIIVPRPGSYPLRKDVQVCGLVDFLEMMQEKAIISTA
ncbi:ATP-binding protein [bacterium]|nr:ATP-binding protein [bacterium]